MASWIPAAIGAGGQLAGAGISSIGGKKAAQAQERAQREALNFARQQEAQRGQRYNTGLEQYRNQWNAWNANRNALLQRYGVDIASPMMQAPQAAPQQMQPAMGAQPGGVFDRYGAVANQIRSTGQVPGNLADLLREG